MFDPTIIVVGNLTADPELRFTSNGKAVANFTIAANHRVKNGNDWQDGETTFYRATVWEKVAENVAASLRKGQQVIAVGSVHTEKYVTQQGEERTSLVLNVDEVGPSLRFAPAQVTRVGGNGNSAPSQPQQSGGWGQPAQQSAPAQDPWSGGQQQTAWGQPSQGNPPF